MAQGRTQTWVQLSFLRDTPRHVVIVPVPESTSKQSRKP